MLVKTLSDLKKIILGTSILSLLCFLDAILTGILINNGIAIEINPLLHNISNWLLYGGVRLGLTLTLLPLFLQTNKSLPLIKFCIYLYLAINTYQIYLFL